MEEDNELLAMSSVNKALKDLSDDARYRVMQWAANKYLQNFAALKPAATIASTAGPAPEAIEASTSADDNAAEQPTDHTHTFDTFAEMLDASGADTETDRFLVAAYWVQEKTGQQSWKSYQTNKLLKDTGHQIKISNCLKRLLGAKPALVVQVSKNASGTKILKLTTEGVKHVQNMLNRR